MIERTTMEGGSVAYVHLPSGYMGQPGSPLERMRAPEADLPHAQSAASRARVLERDLWGVSHYFDRDTMRFFGCRIVDVIVRADVCAAIVLTSQAAGPSRDHGREYRIVHVVYWLAASSVTDDERFSTLRAARKAFKEYAK